MCVDLSNIFLIQSLLYFQLSPVTRHRRVSYGIFKLHYTLPSQREFGPPVVDCLFSRDDFDCSVIHTWGNDKSKAVIGGVTIPQTWREHLPENGT